MADTPDLDRQPAPRLVAGAVSAHDLVAADLGLWDCAEITRNTIELLAERKAYGMRKYGVVLHHRNGRNHPQDAEDEAVDLVVYLRTWIEDAPNLRPVLDRLYFDALWAVVTIRELRVTGRAPDYMMKLMGPFATFDELLATDGELDPERDTGLSMHPETFEAAVCGGIQRNGKICIMPLADDFAYRTCARHGERQRAS